MNISTILKRNWLSVTVLGLAILYIPLWFFGYLGTSTIQSHTSDAASYGHFDPYVDTYLHSRGGDKLLNLDLGTCQITDYHYTYIPIERAFSLLAEAQFADEAAYQQELLRLSAFSQENQNGKILLYSNQVFVGTIYPNAAHRIISYEISNDFPTQ